MKWEKLKNNQCPVYKCGCDIKPFTLLEAYQCKSCGFVIDFNRFENKLDKLNRV